MTPALLDDLVRAAASEVLAARGLDPGPPADPGVGRPRDPRRAEYTTTVALRTPGVAARELADALVARPEVAVAEVAGPGFVNLELTAAGRAAVVADAGRCQVDGAAVRAAADRLAGDRPEAARYAVLRGGRPDPQDTRRVPENPLFRVQYAHARLVALARNAADLGVAAGPDPGVLVEPGEIELVRCLAEFPAAVRSGEPQRVARRLEALAEAVLDVQETVLPRGDDEVTDRHRARLTTVVAARRVLATGLAMLGVSAPEKI